MLLVGTPALSQVTTIPPEPTCACEIRLDMIAELGNESSALMDIPLDVELSDSGVYVVLASTLYEVQFHSMDGQLTRTIGRSGDGPGEFRLISDITLSSSGKLLVADMVGRRITTFHPTGEIERTSMIDMRLVATAFLAFRDGSLVVNGIVGTRDLVGFPLHRLDEDGERVQTYDVGVAVPGMNRPLAEHIRLTASGDTAFWVASLHDYDFALYRLDGSVIRSFRSRVPWNDWNADEIRSGAPLPIVMDIREDRSGRLWVISRMPGADWESAVSPRLTEHGLTPTVDHYGGYYRTVIEVFDPERNRMVQRLHLPGYVLGFASDDVIVTYDDSAVTPRLVFRRARLVSR